MKYQFQARISSFIVILSMLLSALGTPLQSARAADLGIVAENSLPGSPPSEWDVDGAGDETIQGFATDISVNRGQTINFKIDTTAAVYDIKIYRLGYYGGDGARLVHTIEDVTGIEQPDCLLFPIAIGGDSTTSGQLLDCGNWSVSASWQVPADATSGVYIARPTRTDTLGASHIVFIVRNDASHSDLLFQTSDTTWQAYNTYGGYNAYGSSGATMAEKLSYNRPFTLRDAELENYLFNAEYPMIRWLERNGYDVSYTSTIDIERHADLIMNHKVYMSVGHDEYWSQGRRDAVEAARDAGVHLAFFSANEIYWKIRWENDSSGQPYRTRVNYKEGSSAPSGSAEHRNCYNNYDCDPSSIWTGQWREAPGSTPENSLSGQISWRLTTPGRSITVPAEYAPLRFWRNTDVAALGPGGQATLGGPILGYEWDPEYAQYADWYPAGRVLLSSTDETSFAGPDTHHLSLYRAASGALVFGAGTVQWSWGLDANHDYGTSTEDRNVQQATVNLFADMGVQPANLQTELNIATASTDTTPPTVTVTSPASGASVPGGTVTITGTASDVGGVIGVVEVSTNGGTTWRRATGRANWSYSYTAAEGTADIRVRAADDSVNLSAPITHTFTVEPRVCPCSLWDPANPAAPEDNDNRAVEVGIKFRSDLDGWVTAIRYYRHATNTGSHIGNLWDMAGNNLGSVIFTETAPGWQEAVFDAPIPVTANTTYIASYFGYGHYASSEGFFASSGLDNPPLHALQNGVDGPNGVYIFSSSSAFPNQTWNSSNYWVDLVFVTEIGDDTTPPHVSSTTPGNNATGVALTTTITATFNEAMDDTTITGSTFELRDASSNLVPATVSYGTASRKATLTPAAALTPSTTYTATVKGGSGGVSDLANPANAMTDDYVWSFTTSAPPPLPPDEGPGGPILVIADSGNPSNPFGRYYAEILRAEGFNAYYVMDISNVSSTTLTAYDVVLLGEMPLTAGQVEMFDDWVAGGGNLIAFRPAKALAELYGLTDANSTTSEGYLAVNTTTSIGQGVVPDSMQFHGTADHYTLSGASSLATLYNSSTTPTSYPAIARYSHGNGQAVIFTFDLARSIILMRQGNPAWAGLEGDGTTGIRASDMFVGRSGQPNWIDNSKLLIPQADEQMHVLTHAIEQLNAAQLPLPRLWYFPNNIKGALIMTGDSEACSGSCVDVPMQHIQSYGGTYTAYLLGTQPSLAEVNGWLAAGSGVAPHYDDTAEASNPTYANMNAVYDTMTQNHVNAYGVAPRTVRNHWIVWTGWSEQAEIEAAHGIGLDTNYYHWGAWLGGPGYFTGSGLPMRFSDENGAILDIFQSTTQLPDETWGQNIYSTFKTLIDRSIDQGYYGFLNANFHPPSYGSYQTVAGNMMDYANTRGVPIWSAEKLLDFLQARNQARTTNISWNGTQLTFDFNKLTPYNGLTLMIPAQAGGNDLLSITSGGNPVSFTIETIKGYDYALFTASNGSYTASYQPDTTAPTITSHTPTANATNVNVNTNVTVTFNEAMNVTTINGTTFRLQADGTSNDIGATVSYDEGSMTATLNPNTDLAYSTLYHVTVSGTVRDLSNNPMGSDQTWSFTTQPVPPPSVTDTTAADFSAGTLNACVVDATIGDGALRLGAAIDETFSGTWPLSGWSSHTWSGGTPTTSDGLLTVNGAYARNDTLYGPGRTLEFLATFNADAYQHIGFGANDPTFNNGPWIMFSTGETGTQLYARIVTSISGPYNSGDDAIGLGSQYLGSPHQYRIVWNTNSIELYIDGAQVVNRNVTISDSMRVAVSDYNNNGISLTSDWLRMSPPYTSPCTFTSRVFDAGGIVAWESLSWTGITPAGTSLELSYRIGDTPIPYGNWTTFTTIPSSGAALGGSSRYIQYQADLSDSDTSQTPVLEDVTITHTVAVPDTTPPTVTDRTPTPDAVDVAPNTNVTVTFNEAMDATSFSNSTFSLLANGGGSPVSATITYDADSRTATLNPTADLDPAMLYHVTVSGTIHDKSNNDLGGNDTWSFTTAAAPPPVLADTTVTDFSGGTLNSCIADATIGDGAVRLPAALEVDFSGPSLPLEWSSYDWTYDSTTGAYAFSNGWLNLDGVRVNPDPAAYTAGKSLEFVATFMPVANQHIGFGSGSHLPPNSIFDNNPPVWAIFSTGSGGALMARTWSDAGQFNETIPGSWLGSPHLYRIEWTATNAVYFIDGNQVASQSYSSTVTMRPAISDLTQEGTLLTVDWMRMLPYASPCSLTSRVFDAGETVTWDTMSWTGTTPTGTSLGMSYRTGNTSNPDDGIWSAFEPVTGSPASLGSSSRYIQYKADLSTTTDVQTPVLEEISFTQHSGVDATPPVISNINHTVNNETSATITWTTNEPSNSSVAYGTSANTLNWTINIGALVSTHTIDLGGLLPGTTYYYRVSSTDASYNTATSPETPAAPLTFTPPVLPLGDDTAADFNTGTLNSCVADATIGDGALRLPLTLDENFSETLLPNWSWGEWNPGGTAVVSGGTLTVDGARSYSNLNFGPGRSLEFRATFTVANFQNLGFAADGSFNSPWIVIGQANGSDGVYARTNTGTSILLSTTARGEPHVYRIDWTADGFAFFVDSVHVTTITLPVANNMVVMMSDLEVGGGALTIDWLHVTPYGSTCTFTSRVFDAGAIANWQALNWTAGTPAGTSLAFGYRIGNTTAPDETWTSFIPVPTSGSLISGRGQYAQYQVTLSTMDPSVTPDVQDVGLTYDTGSDATAPTIVSHVPAVDATDIAIDTAATVTFSELLNAGTVDGNSIYLRSLGDLTNIPAIVTFAGNVVTLNPNSPLEKGKTYTVTVKSTVADPAGNPLGTDVSWNFTTIPDSVIDTTFATGAGACIIDETIGDGALRLPLSVDENFLGTSLSGWWLSTPWTGGTSTVSGGTVQVGGARLTPTSITGSAPTATVPVVMEFVATFGAAQYQNAGLGAGDNTIGASGMYATGDQPWAMFGTAGTINTLHARLNPGGDIEIPNSANYIGSSHRYRIEWRNGNDVEFYIDNVSVNRRTASFGAITMRPGISDYNIASPSLTVDLMRLTPYLPPCTFESRVLDAGSPVNWLDLSWVGSSPTGTTLGFETRSGNTFTPNGNWSAWENANSPIASPHGQYIQYRATLGTTDPAQTPVIESVLLTYKALVTPTITWNNPADITYGTALSGVHLNATSVPGTFTYIPAAGTILNAGTHTLHVDFIPTDTETYTTASKDVTISVNKAAAAITLDNLSHTYDGTSKSATATTDPTGLTVGFTYNGSTTAPTNAGTYAVSATIDDANYGGTANGSLTIAKAAATITLGGLSHTYDGTAKSATAMTNPTGLTVDFTYNGSSVAPTNANTYAVIASIDDANYEGTASGSLVIAKAAATVMLSGLSHTYDGTAKSATVTTTPASLAVDVTYDELPTLPIALGNYDVVATVTDLNYAGLASGTLVIEQATTTHSITLVPGWNLVSFNVEPITTTIATVLSSLSGSYDLVYAWNAGVASNNWLKYAPSAPGYSNTLSNLDEKMGFWIHMTAADTLEVTGKVPVTTDINLRTTAGGWNLVAYPLGTNHALPEALSNNGVNTDFSLVYVYRANETADPWKLFGRAAPAWANDLTELAPGWGYWIKVSADHTWSVR